MEISTLLAIALCGLFVGISVGHPFLRRILHNKRRRHYQRHPLSLELRHLAPVYRPNRHRP